MTVPNLLTLGTHTSSLTKEKWTEFTYQLSRGEVGWDPWQFSEMVAQKGYWALTLCLLDEALILGSYRAYWLPSCCWDKHLTTSKLREERFVLPHSSRDTFHHVREVMETGV